MIVPLQNSGAAEREIDPELANLRQDCWDQALYAFGTAVLFQRRARSLRRSLRALTFIGVGVPVAVGGAVLSVSTNQSFVAVIAAVAGVLLFAQLIWSVWAIVALWEDRRAYAVESMTDNFRLANAYKFLAEHSPNDIKQRFEVLAAESGSRDTRDYQQDLREGEKRRGMRAALFQNRRACAGCRRVPESPDKATNCAVCGQFGWIIWRWRKVRDAK